MNDEIDISVLIPVYSAEERIKNAIDAVLLQGVRLEIIAVDDESDDRTPVIIREYESRVENFRLITFDQNRGVGAARAAALAVARGKYLAFCDADDTVPHGAYRAMLLAARGADVVVGAYLNIGEGGVATGMFKPPRRRGRTLFRSLFSVCCLWNKLIRRDFVLEKGLKFDTGLTLGEDVVFLGHLYNASPSYNTTDHLVYSHLLHSGSLIHTYTVASFIKHIECRRILLDVCKCPEAERFIAVELSPFLCNFLFCIPSSDFSVAFDVYKEYISEISAFLDDDLFITVTGLRRELFSVVSAHEYIRLLVTSPPRERVLIEYRSGAIGIRWIIKYFSAWLGHKIMK